MTRNLFLYDSLRFKRLSVKFYDRIIYVATVELKLIALVTFHSLAGHRNATRKRQSDAVTDNVVKSKTFF